jgi:hypothetical protein
MPSGGTERVSLTSAFWAIVDGMDMTSVAVLVVIVFGAELIVGYGTRAAVSAMRRARAGR